MALHPLMLAALAVPLSAWLLPAALPRGLPRRAPRAAAAGGGDGAGDDAQEMRKFMLEKIREEPFRGMREDGTGTDDEIAEAPEDVAETMRPPEADANDFSVSKRGEYDGVDDPLDAEWRAASEARITALVEGAPQGVVVDSITWSHQAVRVYIKRPGDGDDAEPLDIETVAAITRVLLDSYEADDPELVLQRLEFEVSSPTTSTLTSQRQYEAYKGFDVLVDTNEPFKNKRKGIAGKLVSRDTEELVINQKGRMVRIPEFLVGEVRLAKAKLEPGDSA